MSYRSFRAMQTTAAMLKRADERIKSLLLSREYCVKQMQARRRKRDEQPWHVAWVTRVMSCNSARDTFVACPFRGLSRGWLWQACCMLSFARALSHAVCCTLPVACRLLRVVCCTPSVACCLLRVVRCTLSAARCLRCVAASVRRVPRPRGLPCVVPPYAAAAAGPGRGCRPCEGRDDRAH